MKEGPKGRRGEVGLVMQAAGGAGGAGSPASRAGAHTGPPALSISGPELPRLAARCAYSPLRVLGMSQWRPSQRHDSTALASLPPMGGGGGTNRTGGDGKGDPGPSLE